MIARRHTTSIVLDIETQRPPADSPAWLVRRARLEAATYDAPANYKDPEAIARAVAAKRDAAIAAAYDDSALDPTLGLVACIGWAVDDEEPVAVGDFAGDFDAFTGERRALYDLAHLLDVLGSFRIVAHNGAGFDGPFLQARALVHYRDAVARGDGGAETFRSLVRALGGLGGKPWDSPIVDTATLWPSCGYGGRKGSAKLDDVCAALGIVRAPSIASRDVPTAWAEGRREAVREHLIADVTELREVWRVIGGVS